MSLSLAPAVSGKEPDAAKASNAGAGDSSFWEQRNFDGMPQLKTTVEPAPST